MFHTLACLNSAAILSCISLLFISCSSTEQHSPSSMKVLDPNLTLELIAKQPAIMTPIGLAIDPDDHLYILESHTHSPPGDYDGPLFDRIKKGVDKDKNGKPEQWIIYADSIEDGMNLAFDKGTLYLSTKNSVQMFEDTDNDGVSDRRQVLASMILPEYVYDHAGILGIAVGPDGWVYVSRGNTGSQYWVVQAANGETIEGYGDGGNVFRLKQDGTQLEEVATGFWNPFDIKFSAEGRLLLTDNDPDSRGPNRLIEVVPGGDYGYQSLYGGSGIHPYLAWNGELPGTLTYAAALGEAPCALMDASYTNFGPSYNNNVLVNVWEENNIVRIPLEHKGSTVVGQSEVLIQGDSLFHPVALAYNSQGDLYITDWVIRQYPNHGHGHIWRLSAKQKKSITTSSETIDRFKEMKMSKEELQHLLTTADPFQQAMARSELAKNVTKQELFILLDSDNDDLRLEGLLILLRTDIEIDKPRLVHLLHEKNEQLQKMALIYTGKHFREDLREDLQQVLTSGKIGPNIFDTYLATIRHLQPDFVNNFRNRVENNSNKLKRTLPEAFVEHLITDHNIPESVRALALPYLETPYIKQDVLIPLLNQAQDRDFLIGLLHALRLSGTEASAQVILGVAINEELDEKIRGQALLSLTYHGNEYCQEVISLLTDASDIIRSAALHYICGCREDADILKNITKLVKEQKNPLLSEAWQSCIDPKIIRNKSQKEWASAVNGHGNVFRGKWVFESRTSQCQNCHKIDGWGGIFGPDLSNIGQSKSRSQLVSAILNPSLEIAPDWQGWYVIDQDGTKHLGRQIDVHLHKVELMNEQGEFDSFEQPIGFGVIHSSLMPEQLYKTMTPSAFNDLISYLESL